jgi:Fe-S cluster assembly iron-binding protein IscA
MGTVQEHDERTTMLTLSRTAAEYIDAAREQSGIPGDATLRIAPSAPPEADGAQPGGGNQIALGFVDQPFDGDVVGDAHGVAYCVAPEIAPDLDAAQLDLADDGASLTLVPNT